MPLPTQAGPSPAFLEKPRHILILGARSPACLEWARAFRAAGWRVSAADSLRWPISRFSRAVDAYHRLPSPRANPARWLDALRQAITRHGVDLVLPTCEETFYLSSGRDTLPCRVLTERFDLMRQLHHKHRFALMTRGWTAQAPETRLLESPDAVMRMRHAAPGWVFKPAYSRFASRALLRPSPAQLARARPSASRPWVAQRYMPGREHCSYSVLAAGRVTAHACYHPRYRAGKAAGVWFEPTDPAPIRAFIERFGAETGYSGQVGFDFIETADGACHVLECNPRATSGVHLFSDQPQQLVAALLDDIPPGEVLRPAASPKMVAAAMLLFAARRHGWRREFWTDFGRADDVLARRDEPWLLPAQCLGLLEVAGRGLLRGRGLLAASTADIEWNGQALDE
ncbi:hypothetical protein KIF53_19520 [Chromobacterium subtsugae]|uniref:ATP-grasp domain-containing protein n=1 Tax=Chromobacterium subtsugae TaxID=251747 RepID=A0ABS7FJD4_9NEIS|nr:MULTISPECIES: hypothetical protein [Chromobacterium]KUM04699.1 hypothetical protein Cv017_12985 [Chromobacterium subtsugae]KZE84672.1 hypothetical protein AWB61_04560 [Chromobacterium sp. F49]MBW7567505.1 hypothetical protein [Chromobacterium subtsugae]MBW8289831.1 hypothetical protein [Chromobacterium subtsugae]WSE90308.1 hypothetical protein U6115_15615 [Chromobacterium subtsugae]